jgi:hypothetical protein
LPSGHFILDYGRGLTSRVDVSLLMRRRLLGTIGCGGFWHSGPLTRVHSALEAHLLADSAEKNAGPPQVFPLPLGRRAPQGGGFGAALKRSDRRHPLI